MKFAVWLAGGDAGESHRARAAGPAYDRRAHFRRRRRCLSQALSKASRSLAIATIWRAATWKRHGRSRRGGTICRCSASAAVRRCSTCWRAAHSHMDLTEYKSPYRPEDACGARLTHRMQVRIKPSSRLGEVTKCPARMHVNAIHESGHRPAGRGPGGQRARTEWRHPRHRRPFAPLLGGRAIPSGIVGLPRAVPASVQGARRRRARARRGTARIVRGDAGSGEGSRSRARRSGGAGAYFAAPGSFTEHCTNVNAP